MNKEQFNKETIEINKRYEDFIRNTIKMNYIDNEIDLSDESNKKEYEQVCDRCIKDQKERLFFYLYTENKGKKRLKELDIKAYEDWDTFKRKWYVFSCFMYKDTPLEEKINKLDRVFKAMEPGLYFNMSSLQKILDNLNE